MPERKYRCPECGRTNLKVEVKLFARLIQKGPRRISCNIEPGDLEQQFYDRWGKYDPMECNDCGHANSAYTFETAYQEQERKRRTNV